MLRIVLMLVPLGIVSQCSGLELIAWNIESGGADPAIIAQQLGELPRVDAYLLQEVNARDIGRLAAAVRKRHGKAYKYYLSSLGGGDRLAIIFDESKYQVRAFSELMSYGEYRLNDFNHRSPLVAHLKRRGDGMELFLVNVHFARGNADLRGEQADGLREWAKEQTLPVVLAGDCNFDYSFVTKQGNDAYQRFFADGTWKLAEPEEWIDSNWSDRNGDGIDDYPDSCLDFGAIKANGKSIEATSRVIVRAGDFPDTNATSDHRPIYLRAIMSEED